MICMTQQRLSLNIKSCKTLSLSTLAYLFLRKLIVVMQILDCKIITGKITSYEDSQGTAIVAIGSGVLIQNQYILTARHCVEQKQKTCKKVVFQIKNRNSPTMVYQSCDGPFLELFDIDLALVKIKKEGSSDKRNKMKAVNINEFIMKSQKTLRLYSGMRRQFQDLKFDLIQKGEIFYEGETQGGDSGSPIFLIQSDDKLQGYLIGIHTAKLNQTSYDKQRKKGAFFNADNVNKVNYHIQKLKAQNFVYETSHQLEKISEQMQDSLLDYNQFSFSEYANKIASFMNNAAVVFKTVNEKLIGQTSFNKTMKYFNQTLQTFMNNLCNKINNIKNMYDQDFLQIRKLLFEASNISIDATLSKIYENKKDIQEQRPSQLPKNASWDQLLLSSSSIISDKKDSQIYD